MMSAFLSRILILVLGTLYPAYRSYKAIKNKDVREHVKWMMYWIVFALFTTLETFLDTFFSWFPFYYEIKILFILWILSPATHGSSLLYKKVVHPLLTSREKEIDELIEKTKQQGYSTFLQLFSSGFNYVSNLFLTSAIKGQSMLGNQLKKSLSLNDVNDTSNSNLQIPSTSNNFILPERIDEDDEFESDQENDRFRLTSLPKSLNDHGRVYSKKTSLSNGNNFSRDYEIINDFNDDVEKVKKSQITTTIAGSKQRRARQVSTTTLNYKSTEPSHYGTITRGKTSKSKSLANSLTAQTIYDNDS